MKYEHIFEKIYRETHIVERRRKTTEVFIEEAKQIYPEYDYSKVNYINNYTKVIVGCPKHGDFLTTPNNLLQGYGCPICSESKGEIEVREWLENHNITYKRQHRFADLNTLMTFIYLTLIFLLNIMEYNIMKKYHIFIEVQVLLMFSLRETVSKKSMLKRMELSYL